MLHLCILFTVVIYLFYLRYNNIVKYTNTLFNLHFYVSILYVLLFLTSALLTFCVYTLELAGEGLGEIFKSMNIESLKERDACLAEGSLVQEKSGEEEVHRRTGS